MTDGKLSKLFNLEKILDTIYAPFGALTLGFKLRFWQRSVPFVIFPSARGLGKTVKS